MSLKITINGGLFKGSGSQLHFYYKIEIVQNNWINIEYRRYSEFKTLEEKLHFAKNIYRDFCLPKCPSWVRISSLYTNQISKSMLMKRGNKLEVYLEKLEFNNIALSTPYFPAFLGLNQKVIIKWINGNGGYVYYPRESIHPVKRLIIRGGKSSVDSIKNNGVNPYTLSAPQPKKGYFGDNERVWKKNPKSEEHLVRDKVMEEDIEGIEDIEDINDINDINEINDIKSQRIELGKSKLQEISKYLRESGENNKNNKYKNLITEESVSSIRTDALWTSNEETISLNNNNNNNNNLPQTDLSESDSDCDIIDNINPKYTIHALGDRIFNSHTVNLLEDELLQADYLQDYPNKPNLHNLNSSSQNHFFPTKSKYFT